MSMPAQDPDSSAVRASAAAGMIVAAAALGELAVGILAALFPGPVLGLLLEAPVEGNGLVVARMLGVSIAALGCTWWMARREAANTLTWLGGGLLVYNIGVAAIFVAYVWSQHRLLWIPSLVAAAHALIAVAFALAATRSGSVSQPA